MTKLRIIPVLVVALFLISACRPYSNTSPFNTKIPANPALATNNASLVAAWASTPASACGTTYPCMSVGSYYYSAASAIYYAPKGTPLVTVQMNIGKCNAYQVHVPIPAGAKPDGSHEGHMAIGAADGTEYDFYDMQSPNQPPKGPENTGGQCPTVGDYTAGEMGTTNWISGSGSEHQSPRGSGTAEGAGTILQQDEQGAPVGSTIDHALAISYRNTCSHSQPWCPIVAPSLYSDGTSTNQATSVPEGARVQLDPSINCATWPSFVAEWQRQICRTLQVYGAIIVDTNAYGPTIDAQNEVSLTGGYQFPWASGPSPYYIPNDILSHFRFLAWPGNGA